MNLDFITRRPTHRRLLLIFTGWAGSPHLFAGMRVAEGYDVAVVSDYRLHHRHLRARRLR